MNVLELLIIAVGLSMDACAVAICKGLAMDKISIRKAGIVGLYFGTFQAGMPLIGYYLGEQFEDSITSFDHWIAFALLVFIGFNMLKESRSRECVECGSDSQVNASLGFKQMSVLAIATSIDALAAGVSFAFLEVDIAPAATFIGITTFTLSVIGVKIGNVFGAKYKSKAELAGGIILILMGVKILLDHLGIL
jgi:putative Mn2+ efflux pump MntP